MKGRGSLGRGRTGGCHHFCVVRLGPTRATAGFGLSGLLPAAHHSAPLPRAAEDYKATIDGMRAELAQVPFPGKAKVAA